MDKNTFFREATLKICGTLEIEESMQALLRFLMEVMPVTKMFLQDYDHSFNAMRSIAYATQTKCGKLDLLTPLPKDARELAGNVPNEQDAFLFKDPQGFAISREMLKFHGIKASSLIIMVLRIEEKMLGSLVLISDGVQKLKDEHLKLALLLKEPLIIAMSNTLKHREILKLKDLLADDNRYLQGELRRLSGDEIVGANFGLKDVMEKVRRVSSVDSPVLLLGETGVGKDVIANAIHYSSSRSKGPFVSVNCGAIPETLIDSELFGHEKGAFTGALARKRGRFERADHGTIFLDEVGELPLLSQVRLLRIIQNKTFERVGGSETISLNIRIIAASNRNLEQMVADKKFREDLWFRLNVFPINIPPLRLRKIDIPELVQYFIELKSRELKLPQIPTLSDNSIEILSNYSWPGNVRELQNIIERELILYPTGPLTFDGLKQQIESVENQLKSTNDHDSLGTFNLDGIIISHIKKALLKTEGKIHGKDGAANLLGINASTLRNRMKKLGIKYKKSDMYN